MKIKSKLVGVLFLFSMALIGCRENSTNSFNRETPTPSPKRQENNVGQNTEQLNSNGLSANETREHYQNLAKNNPLKTPTPLPKADFPVVTESNLNIEEEIRKMKDKEEVVGIVVQENADNTKTIGVRLKSGIVCGFPLEMMPKAKETPDEEVIKIVMENKNSKRCKDYSKKAN